MMKTTTGAALALALGLTALAAAPAVAQNFEFSVYSGWQTAPHSRVRGDYPGTGADYDALIGWEGRSFEMPPYYGLRGTWWQNEQLGFALEFTHTKVYAPDDEKEEIGFDDLEFTDGLNILTANTMYRWPDRWGSVTPYVGGGLGLSLPHVDVDSSNGFDTYELQVGGPAMRVLAGASYDLTDRVSVFGEYQFTYSANDVELDGDGTLESDIKTNAVNFGLSLRF